MRADASFISKSKRWISSGFVGLASRRFGFASPPILAVALVTSASILLIPGEHFTPDDRSNTIRTLLQIASIIFGMNIVGFTLNANQFGQSTSIRSLLSAIAEIAEPCTRICIIHIPDYKSCSALLLFLLSLVPHRSLICASRTIRGHKITMSIDLIGTVFGIS